MTIAFMDLKSQYQHLKPAIKARIDGVLEHGRYIMGPEVDELEQALAEFVGVKHAITCASGTDALLMPLMAYDIKPGDAVFTTPFSFIATAEVIALLGARPVFVDIDPRTFNMDPAKLEAAITAVKNGGRWKPRGVIPVDLFGLPADADAIMATASRHDLFVLEDAAQSLGGLYRGRRAGSLGHVAGTSFYPAKPLGAYGDGGAIFTDDDHLADILVSIRQHGQGVDKYHNIRLGLNGRLDAMQAAVLLVKLAAFPGELDARQAVAEAYDRLLQGVVTPHIPEGYRSSWALYSVLHEARDQVQAKLKEMGVPTVVYYAQCLHEQRVFADLGYRRGDFPVAEATADRIFSLPMHPFLERAHIEQVAAAVERATS